MSHETSPASPRPVSKRISRWVLVAVGTALGIGLTYAVIMAFGSDFHRLLTKLAGGLIGAVKDNQGVSLVVTGTCVALVWGFIAIVCALQWRRERTASSSPASARTPSDDS